jgi:hypothetical protein
MIFQKPNNYRVKEGKLSLAKRSKLPDSLDLKEMTQNNIDNMNISHQ